MKTLTKSKLSVDSFMKNLIAKNPGEVEFHQAVREFALTIIPFVNENPRYQQHNLLERMTEPDRVIMFRVTWVDDKDEVQVNKGYRVQFNNAIGPYKGGLRFHPSVNLGILKFLGFEQVFKNSLTTLPMGGAKGGSDFDPKGKSDMEVMRFCQTFMNELFRHIGHNTDVPAGDIGVGAREVGFLYGEYKKLANMHTGVITGKGMTYGGSLIRPEATGYGTVYFVDEMLKTKGDSIKGKRCIVSGSGNVAQFTIEKVLQLGGSVHSASDSTGCVYDKQGFDMKKLEYLMDLKNNRRGRIKEFADEFDLIYVPNGSPWDIKCDIAFPSATQNEIHKKDAENLVKNGCIAIGEGANMPSTIDAINVFQDAKVATSGLEMTQNSRRLLWTREEVDSKLKSIMRNIHEQCVKYGSDKDGNVDYVKGANIAGFVKIAEAMIAEGVV
jgi:glutamate dehydrogenase/leucine dehydrogenase